MSLTEKIKKAHLSELKKLKQAHWAALNTARCILLNRIEDLTALADDIRLQELALKKELGNPEVINNTAILSQKEG